MLTIKRRATLEALAKLHQPREQTVKHVHVNEGGRAIVADQIHQHQRTLASDGLEALGTPVAADRSEKPERLRSST